MSEWIVARTQQRREKWASENLMRQGYQFYYPRVAVRGWRNSSRKIETRIEPLFEGYIFVELTKPSWRPILGTFGISTVVMLGERPAPMPFKEIQRLRAMEDADGFVVLPKRPRLQKGDTVRIVDDSRFTEGTIGIWLGSTSKERERILLNFLGRKVKTLISTNNVVPLR